MSILDKIMFWKHDDLKSEMDKGIGLDKTDINPDANLGLDLPEHKEMPIPPQQDLNQPSQDMAQPSHDMGFEGQKMQHYPQQPVMSPNRDMELIAAKLDALKATLDGISHRLENIERMAREGI